MEQWNKNRLGSHKKHIVNVAYHHIKRDFILTIYSNICSIYSQRVSLNKKQKLRQKYSKNSTLCYCQCVICVNGKSGHDFMRLYVAGI